MRHIKLVIHNFLSIEHAEIPLSNQGLILLEGANGAGKSTIMEALCWVDYGATVRGVKHDKIIADFAGKNCFVQHEFAIGGATYVVTRYRKHEGLPESWLTITKDGEDLTASTFTATSLVLDGLLPIKFDTFVRTVMLCPNLQYKFTSSTDIEMKQQIEEIIGSHTYVNALEKARASKKDLTAELTGFTNKLNVISDNMYRSASDITSAQNELDALKSDSAKSVDQLRKMLSDTQAFTDEQTAQLVSVHSELGTVTGTVLGLMDSRGKVNNDYSIALYQTQGATQELATLQTAIKKLEANTCPTCSQSWIGAQDILAKNKLRIITLEADILANEPIIAEGKPKLEALDAQISMHKKLTEDLKKREAALNTGIQKLQTKIKEFQTTIAYKGTAHDTLVARLAKSEEDLAHFTKERDALVIQGETVKNKLQYVDTLLTVFQHVRALVLQNSLDDLNEIIAQFLDVLYPGLKVTINPSTDKASGGTSNKFSIAVSDRSYESWSDGEKRRVDLAIQLGLAYLFRKYSSCGSNILILDEVTDKLDPNGASAFVEVLQSIVGNGLETIFIVTHLPYLKSMLPISWGIQKVDGKTVISM